VLIVVAISGFEGGGKPYVPLKSESLPFHIPENSIFFITAVRISASYVGRIDAKRKRAIWRYREIPPRFN
jgi:hypothetical protein